MKFGKRDLLFIPCRECGKGITAPIRTIIDEEGEELYTIFSWELSKGLRGGEDIYLKGEVYLSSDSQPYVPEWVGQNMVVPPFDTGDATWRCDRCLERRA